MYLAFIETVFLISRLPMQVLPLFSAFNVWVNRWSVTLHWRRMNLCHSTLSRFHCNTSPLAVPVTSLLCFCALYVWGSNNSQPLVNFHIFVRMIAKKSTLVIGVCKNDWSKSTVLQHLITHLLKFIEIRRLDMWVCDMLWVALDSWLSLLGLRCAWLSMAIRCLTKHL